MDDRIYKYMQLSINKPEIYEKTLTSINHIYILYETKRVIQEKASINTS